MRELSPNSYRNALADAIERQLGELNGQLINIQMSRSVWQAVIDQLRRETEAVSGATLHKASP